MCKKTTMEHVRVILAEGILPELPDSEQSFQKILECIDKREGET